MIIKKIKRPIEAIAEQLQLVMKRETTDIIAIGGLLLEAKERLTKHGRWMPWLKVNFGSSKRTADNYINAARLAGQIGNVANLKLRPTALYLLGSYIDDEPDDLFSPAALKAILKVAETEWVNAERAYAIAQSLVPPVEEEKPSEEESLSDQEIADILDGPPPEVPPAPPPSPPDVILPPFVAALATLDRLKTKSSTNFVGNPYTPDQIDDIIAFLKAVRDAMTKRRAA